LQARNLLGPSGFPVPLPDSICKAVLFMAFLRTRITYVASLPQHPQVLGSPREAGFYVLYIDEVYNEQWLNIYVN
jgi:hypothetical protein